MLNIIGFFIAAAMAAGTLMLTVMAIDIVKNWRH
jgi:hypothetical protein